MLVAMAAVVPATATAAPSGPRYTWTTINVPNAAYTVPNGVNDFGVVAGYYGLSSEGPDQGFIEQGGHFTTIDDPLGVNGTNVTWDNDLGVIGGWYYDASGTAHGFTYIHGTFTTIDDPNAGTAGYPQGTSPWVENLLGVMVGYYVDSNDVYHGFIYQGGHFTTIDAPYSGPAPTANQGTWIGYINDLGELSGGFDGEVGSSYSFVDNHGHYTTIFDPASVSTEVSCVNDFGLILGDYTDSSGNANGFVLSKGMYTTIDDPLAVTTPAGQGLGTSPSSANNLGVIVGDYYGSDGSWNGFEATPSH
jgi:hypothetical protein